MIRINRYTHDLSNDNVWGPPFWFTLHNGSIKYPIRANDYYKEHMKYFIMGIPVMIPCDKCKCHAMNYITSRKDEINEAVTGRVKLFKFFVDFHNDVNRRKGKRILSYVEAYDLYSSRNINDH